MLAFIQLLHRGREDVVCVHAAGSGLERGHGFAGLSMHGYKLCTAYVVSVVVPHNVNQTVPSLQSA